MPVCCLLRSTMMQSKGWLQIYGAHRVRSEGTLSLFVCLWAFKL